MQVLEKHEGKQTLTKLQTGHMSASKGLNCYDCDCYHTKMYKTINSKLHSEENV